MKTIGIIDRCDGNRIMKYYGASYGEKRLDRIIAALESLKHMGNIEVYYISGGNGNKKRLIKVKGL